MENENILLKQSFCLEDVSSIETKKVFKMFTREHYFSV